MKAERRHELETNDLARKIVQAPDYWKQYGGRIMLAATVVVVVAMLVTFKLRQNRESLATARQSLAEMKVASAAPPADAIAERAKLAA